MKKSELILLLREWEKQKERKIIAIDGRCASGKTTLAYFISENIACDCIHIDDFFLPFEKRTKEWAGRAGGNIDFERLISEVLIPIKNGECYIYSKFSCKDGSLTEGVKTAAPKITVVEGSYSCHPSLYSLYDLHIFIDIDKKTQSERILRRNKRNSDDFFKKWIPYEERYFSEFKIKENCEIVLTQAD